MKQVLFVVDNPDKWPLEVSGVKIVSARKYLTDTEFSNLKNCKIFNLCNSYRYQSAGYYVSLLADARNHKPIPSIETIQDMKSQSIVRSISEDLEETMQKALAHIHADEFVLPIYFSKSIAKCYDSLSRQLFNLFPAPLLEATFEKNNEIWKLQNISPIAGNEIPPSSIENVVSFAKEYFAAKNSGSSKRMTARFDLAILMDKDDATPPSDPKAIQRFIKAAESLEISTEIISKNDYGRLSEFDALFIRQTTSVNSHTYRFARKAEADGLVVIDDPKSIVRCTNKVFLAELMEHHEIPTPRTIIVHKGNSNDVLSKLGLPCILKQPDSAFSLGVVKVETEDEYKQKISQLLEKSDLIVAQEFIPTSFDWRIGILDQKPLYACKYFMARKHWQIYNHNSKGNDKLGKVETVPIELVPSKVMKTALKSANVIGNGLYGVDLKVLGKECYVIEVNDNPSIDHGIEDDLMKDVLYERIMEVFLKRMEQKRESKKS